MLDDVKTPKHFMKRTKKLNINLKGFASICVLVRELTFIYNKKHNDTGINLVGNCTKPRITSRRRWLDDEKRLSQVIWVKICCIPHAQVLFLINKLEVNRKTLKPLCELLWSMRKLVYAQNTNKHLDKWLIWMVVKKCQNWNALLIRRKELLQYLLFVHAFTI